VKLDNTPITQEERQECARVNISDQDIISSQVNVASPAVNHNNSVLGSQSNSSIKGKQVSKLNCIKLNYSVILGTKIVAIE